MGSSSSSMGSSSSSSIVPLPHQLIKHDVFLSFRGEDTRCNFTNHLYAALRRNQILSFIDYDGLKRGDEISPALLKSIEESKISVIIFSKDYASSKWCLDELATIIDCKKKCGQTVVPIFYHVEPSDVRKQSGSFQVAFAEHVKQFKNMPEKVQKWRNALTEASNLSGWSTSEIRLESDLVDRVVGDILSKLNNLSTASSGCEGLVGLDSRVEKIKSLLCIDSLNINVRAVGIWGMGGIGKTTLADVVYNQIFSQFEGQCFKKNFREQSEKYGVESVRDEILSKILGEPIKIDTPSIPQYIQERLQRKKVLVVLDDLSTSKQLKDLLGSFHKFCPGSRFIITTRDKQVLCYKEIYLYEFKRFNEDEALQIFRNHAFPQKQPPDDLENLSNRIVAYANGNPLVLGVLGSFLRGKSKQDWESALSNLKMISAPEIHGVLKISYESLSREQKSIFLDIACFFKGQNRYDITSMLDNCYNFSTHACLTALVDKSLISESKENKLEMHDLIQEMGQEIVCQESEKNPGGRSRLWHYDDVYRVLRDNTGTDAIVGISLNMFKTGDLTINSTAFGKMPNLKLFILYNHDPYERSEDISKVYLPEGLECFPSELRYLHWDRYPLKTLPLKFSMENLVELVLPHSKVEQLWKGEKRLHKLKRIDLQNSESLVGIPDLSNAVNLKRIHLPYCRSLVEVHPSIQSLVNLRYLYLRGCENLKGLPGNIHFNSLLELDLSNCINLTKFPQISGNIEHLNLNSTAIEEVPSFTQYLNIHHLHMFGCKNLKSFSSNHFISPISIYLSNCINLMQFPQISGNVVSLCLNETAIEEIPSSVECLTELFSLRMEKCTRLKHFSIDISKLKSLFGLSLSGCSRLESFSEISEKMKRLAYLVLDGASSLKELPDSIKNLDGLGNLSLKHCKNLESIPGSIGNLTSLSCIFVAGCPKLNRLPENLDLRLGIDASGTPVIQLPSSIARWKKVRFLKLAFSKLTEILEDLCFLSSLEELNLSGNNFKSLPANITQLFRLKLLYLNDCDMLESLPEFPLGLTTLEVMNCKQLHDLPKLPLSDCEEIDASEFQITSYSRSAFTKKVIEFKFTNCLKLNENASFNFLADAEKRFLYMASASFKYCHQERHKGVPAITFCLPGSEIPHWVSSRHNGSSFSINLSQNWYNENFIGFALCAVVEFEKGYYGDKVVVECGYKFETNYGDIVVFWHRSTLIPAVRYDVIEDHVMIGYDPCFNAKLLKGEHTVASFGFKILKRKDCLKVCKVKSCGAHPLYSQPGEARPSISTTCGRNTRQKVEHSMKENLFKFCGNSCSPLDKWERNRICVGEETEVAKPSQVSAINHSDTNGSENSIYNEKERADFFCGLGVRWLLERCGLFR